MEVTIEELLPPRHEGNRRYAVSVNSPRLYTPFIYKRFEVEEKYDVCDFLGSGQFGIVCLALDTSNGEKVAIKKLENIFRGKHYAQRVIRELLIHSQINHPFVVALEKIMRPVDQDTFHDIYIVMETMKENLQTSLRERAQKSKREPLAPLNAKLIMNQLLRGVQYLHAADVLHRDLKPSNILLNDDQRVKLCDFGLARVIKPGMTQLVVSAPYRPPELFLRNMSDQSNYGPAVDIWSLGCIFADLLLQRPMSLGFLDDQTDLTNLRRIADTIGRPDDDDLSEVMTNDDARPFLKNMFPQTPSRPFSYIFRDVTDKSAVDLLERMLVFNPRKRISIADALQHEYMADMTVDVLAREFDLQPGEVEKLNDVNPPRIKMNVRGPYQSPKEELRKIIFDECLNIQAAR